MEQLQDEAIATAGPEQHGPSKQQQKKGKRTKVEAAIDSMTKAFLPRAVGRLMKMDYVLRE